MFEIILAVLAQFVIGAVWYMALFGTLWGKIHGFDKLDKKTQKEMQAKMGPYYFLQLMVTATTTIVLQYLLGKVSSVSPYALTLLVWTGFVVPTQASAVVFGGTEARWIGTKLAIMAGGSLACLLAATAIMTAL